MSAAVFLDRDGVLNEVVLDAAGMPHPPATPADLRLAPGVAEACGRLRDAGFRLVVVTNQPDVARGTQRMETVDLINEELRRRLPLDDVLVCSHDDGDGCACRKPRPGLLYAAAGRWGIDLSRSVMVGDRWRDVEAGRAAGCRTVLVVGGHAEPTPAAADHEAPSLAAAVEWILTLRAS